MADHVWNVWQAIKVLFKDQGAIGPAGETIHAPMVALAPGTTITATTGLPAGASTAALQTAGNISLSTIAGAVSGGEVQTSLPTGAATAANQVSIITALGPGLPAALGATGGLLIEGIGGAQGVNVQVQDGSGNAITSTASALDVNIKSGAASGYAEDTAHQSGDLGTQMLTVRKDTPAALANADGDYAPPETDAVGQTWVNASLPLPVTSKTVVVTAQPTITSGAYHAKDALGGKQALANAARVSGGAGRISRIVVVDDDAQAAEIVITFFNADMTATADNAAFDPSDADMENCIGSISIYSSDYQSFADNAVATKNTMDFPFVLNATTTLTCQAMVTGAPTYASTSSLTFKYVIDQA